MIEVLLVNIGRWENIFSHFRSILILSLLKAICDQTSLWQQQDARYYSVAICLNQLSTHDKQNGNTL